MLIGKSLERPDFLARSPAAVDLLEEYRLESLPTEPVERNNIVPLRRNDECKRGEERLVSDVDFGELLEENS